MLLALGWASLAHADGITVQGAQLQANEEGVSLSASFDIDLGNTLEDALNRGVALPFIIELEVTRPRWYWLDEAAVVTARQRQLTYNALTRQYRVALANPGAGSTGLALTQSYDRLDDARRALASVRGWQVASLGQLKKGSTYDVAVRLRLDVSRLPKPFQVSALGSREWNLGSDWHRFSFTP